MPSAVVALLNHIRRSSSFVALIPSTTLSLGTRSILQRSSDRRPIRLARAEVRANTARASTTRPRARKKM